MSKWTGAETGDAQPIRLVSSLAMSALIPVQTLDKPAFQSPCNGCGHCCIQEVCELGRELGDDVHCKALTAFPDGSFSCGLIIDPYRHLPEARLTVWRRLDRMADYPAGEDALKQHYADLLGAGRGL